MTASNDASTTESTQPPAAALAHGSCSDSTEPAATTDLTSAPLSKNAQKRLLKQQRWEATRDERKEKKKQKLQQKKAERRELRQKGIVLPPLRNKPKPVGEQSEMTVVLDMAFDDLMTDKEIVSIVSQVSRCYSINKGANRRARLMATEFHGRAKERFETRMSGYENWQEFKFESQGYLDLFDKDRLVYLTADSDTVLQALDESKVYIIGAFVDKNRHKGLTFKKAQEQGIATAQLPIGDHLKMASRKVLTVNQVLDILLHVLDTKDWKQSLMTVIPPRKLNDAQVLTATADPSPSDNQSTTSPPPSDLAQDQAT
ncbi:tRNA (guanine(9)-N(1))-methyltransferase [Dimargaris verticillata]|uniref:tRNA (guanine(9)-N1)-methyltransferase n=1 Tax=Dimargaris verticillata TaxID=2761393 RepID=A0A9W8E814_9FUNG|nr:tRNA (guanine(9)-N(1))-methyltransferase [Dimargaris verticillata]